MRLVILPAREHPGHPRFRQFLHDHGCGKPTLEFLHSLGCEVPLLVPFPPFFGRVEQASGPEPAALGRSPLVGRGRERVAGGLRQEQGLRFLGGDRPVDHSHLVDATGESQAVTSATHLECGRCPNGVVQVVDFNNPRGGAPIQIQSQATGTTAAIVSHCDMLPVATDWLTRFHPDRVGLGTVIQMDHQAAFFIQHVEAAEELPFIGL